MPPSEKKPKGRPPKQSVQQEQPPKPLNEPSKTLYLVNYWVPFPASEYGGLQAVVASDDEECYKLLVDHSTVEIKYHKNYEELIKARIKKASKFQLVGGYLPEVVRSFTT